MPIRRKRPWAHRRDSNESDELLRSHTAGRTIDRRPHRGPTVGAGMSDEQERARHLNEFGRDRLPGMIGLEILKTGPDEITGRIPVTYPLIAGTGFLWAPVVVALADTLCAYGVSEHMPEGATSFTTVELKTNFLGTVAEGGAITGRATPVHLGRSTQVWDATVQNEANQKPIALFRCTQMILYPHN